MKSLFKMVDFSSKKGPTLTKGGKWQKMDSQLQVFEEVKKQGTEMEVPATVCSSLSSQSPFLHWTRPHLSLLTFHVVGTVGDMNKNSWFGVEIFCSEYLCREGSPYPNGTSHLELEEYGVMEMPPVIWSDLGDCFPR